MGMTTPSGHGVGLRLLLLAGLGLACQDPVMMIGPDNNPVLVNQTDNFSYQASNLDNANQTLTWTWTNTGSSAIIEHNSLVPHGITQMTIRDAAGKVVYDLNIQLIYQETQNTDSGTPGAWTIELALYGTTGELNFSLTNGP
jgi:hypothetical protein